MTDQNDTNPQHAGARQTKPWVKMALEFGPLLVFFVFFTRYKDAHFVIGGTDYSGFVVATALFIPLMAVSTFLLWRLTGRLAPMQIATLVLVVVFGGLSVWFNDPHFFKMKPTIIYLIFAAILAFGLWRGKPWLQLVMDGAIPMKTEGWTILTKRLIALFLFLAVANEVIWRTMSDQAWVNFKTFGLTILMFGFFIAQGPLFSRYGTEKPKNDD
ncbi:inner membrane-spanning protein YciB [Paenirhodobacter populi]|uniref:inner membrane-spanning protein YciB n=1 Tax=Paenirhodobacter populi TaxID=2306993 RepID=UPI000FE2AF3F|nr:inner membrane-spanning protein YciB [Sinirhodobacter populi]RWR10824.1 septation protein IspZ [Sinirhodobacter populi]